MRPGWDDREIGQLAFFSDAVFAVVLVLVVSHILLPETYVPSGALHDALGDAAPQLFGSAVAFAAIALLWAEHHRMFGRLRRGGEGLLWGTLVFLGCVAMLSYPAAVFTKHLDAPVAMLFFAGALTVTGLVWSALWWWIVVRGRLIDESLDSKRVLRRSLSVPVIFALSAPIAPLTFGVLSDRFSFAIVAWIVALPIAQVVLREPDSEPEDRPRATNA
jgi:uncharacterized membrane protein